MTQQLLSDLLRSETRQVHHALDHHPALRTLVSPRIDTQEYQRSLEALYRSWVPLEIAIEQGFEQFPLQAVSAEWADWLDFSLKNYFPRRYALKRDLESMGTTPDGRHFPVCFRFATLPELMGGLYVCFGAQMGGQFIAARLLAANLPESPTEFFECTLTEPREFWQRFRHKVDGFSGSTDIRLAAVRSADSTFETFRPGLG